MSRHAIGLGLGLALLGVAAPSAAWAPITGSRPTWCGAAPYWMHSAGSADLGPATSEMVVRQAMDDWTRVSCTALTANWQGTTGSRPGSYEGTAVIGWVESGWTDGSGAIGVTGPQWNGRGCIIEADMKLNGVNYTWITGSGRGSNVNTYSIVLHEGGHFYGLGHSSDSRATMYFAYGGGISSLNADDEAGICALYPGGSGTDCTTTGCPSGQECVSGACQPITGDGTVCAPCSDNGECGGPADYCIGYPDGAGYCGKACRSDADCEGDRCVSLSGGGSNCARLDSRGVPDCSASPPPGCRSDADCSATERCNTGTGNCEPAPTDLGGMGDPCTAGAECNSAVCFAGSCTRSCDWLDPASCPAGFYCDGAVTGVCGDALCVPGAAGATPEGGSCAENTDCAGLFCGEGLCSTPCVPGVGESCPTGKVCRAGGLPGCGSCQDALDLGEPCMTNEDCASRFCAVEGDRTFCTDLCDDASPCPAGFTCSPAGDVSVCAPPAGSGGRSDGGCCSVATGASRPGDPPWLLLLVLPLLLMARRRRRG